MFYFFFIFNFFSFLTLFSRRSTPLQCDFCVSMIVRGTLRCKNAESRDVLREHRKRRPEGEDTEHAATTNIKPPKVELPVSTTPKKNRSRVQVCDAFHKASRRAASRRTWAGSGRRLVVGCKHEKSRVYGVATGTHTSGCVGIPLFISSLFLVQTFQNLLHTKTSTKKSREKSCVTSTQACSA